MESVREYLVPFENDHFRMGRLTLFKVEKGFQVQVDIILKESCKIFEHIGLQQHGEEKETLELGLQLLRERVTVP